MARPQNNYTIRTTQLWAVVKYAKLNSHLALRWMSRRPVPCVTASVESKFDDKSMNNHPLYFKKAVDIKATPH